MIIAIAISKRFKKTTLLNAYCHVAYLGWRARGVEQASKRLHIDIHRLSKKDAATLAAMFKLPMPEHPSEGYLNKLSQRIEYIIGVQAKLEHSQ